MGVFSSAASNGIGVLVADSNQMNCQLLVGALRRRPEFRVSACTLDMDAILSTITNESIDIALFNTDHDMSPIRRLHLAHPQVGKVLLLEAPDRNAVVNAFRSGVRGIFSFSDSSVRMLCKCIQSVHQGQIWANNEHLQYLLDLVSQVPSLRVVNSQGINLLTPREEQVVALVADGMSNRDIAHELGLSEHTVKKYIFRIFDKLGVSTRVELVLYAVTRGNVRHAEWVPT